MSMTIVADVCNTPLQGQCGIFIATIPANAGTQAGTQKETCLRIRQLLHHPRASRKSPSGSLRTHKDNQEWSLINRDHPPRARGWLSRGGRWSPLSMTIVADVCNTPLQVYGATQSRGHLRRIRLLPSYHLPSPLPSPRTICVASTGLPRHPTSPRRPGEGRGPERTAFGAASSPLSMAIVADVCNTPLQGQCGIFIATIPAHAGTQKRTRHSPGPPQSKLEMPTGF